MSKVLSFRMVDLMTGALATAAIVFAMMTITPDARAEMADQDSRGDIRGSGTTEHGIDAVTDVVVARLVDQPVDGVIR